MREGTLLADGLAFPEGPRWHDGSLYFVDHLEGHVNRVAEDGSIELLASLPEGASGMGWRPDGTHLVVSMHDKKVMSIGGEPAIVADLSDLVGGPLNEMVVGGSGRAYVGNFGSDLVGGEPLRETVLVRVDPDGSARIAADNLIFPNGVVLTPDESTLIVAESFALRLTAFEVSPGGDLSNRRVWASFGEPPSLNFSDVVALGVTAPDGIALDAEGAIWVSDPLGNAVLRVAEGGAILDSVSTGDLGSYAVALGGPDGRTLFVCANARLGQIEPGADRRGQVWSFQVDVPGAGWP